MSTPTETLWSLFKSYDEYKRKHNPEFATYEGDYRYNDQVSDLSQAAVDEAYTQFKQFRSDLNNIDYRALEPDDQLNFDMFALELDLEIESHDYPHHYLPLNQMTGFQLGLPQLIDIQPLKKAADFADYFARLRGFGQQVDDVIANMQTGVKKGYTNPRWVVEQTLPQMEGLKNKRGEESVFYLPLKKDLDITQAERDALHTELCEVIDEVNGHYDRLHKFTQNEYLPHCRETAGIWDLPDGKNMYEFAIKFFTAPDMHADEIHELGLQEVARIHGEKAKLIKELGFEGTVKEFNQHLRSSPDFYAKTKEELWNQYEACMAECYERIPPLFHSLPDAPCELKEVEDYKAASAPQAYYYPAPEDGSRPGYYYLNTHDLPSRPLYNMTALTLHEAVPGHHLQIALAQELEHLPYFRRRMILTAYVEGWGLYSEFLGHEMDMYGDPYQHYGALSFEIWRACRLVVDTGLHHKKWTRQQAIDFMKEHVANTEMDIIAEVDRYSIMPGQALSYKIGEIKIKQLRKHAEATLGDRFDVRDFHQVVLNHGALPLSVLEHKVESWLNNVA